MSLADLQQSRDALISFSGRRCFCTVAANSLKLHIDEDRKGGSYIWVDPSWALYRGFEEVASSADCPPHTDSDYEPRFRVWCGRLIALRATTFEAFEESDDGSISLLFGDDYRLFLPLQENEEDSDWWFDHWYARIAEKG
jgi:hypothetical protein